MIANVNKKLSLFFWILEIYNLSGKINKGAVPVDVSFPEGILSVYIKSSDNNAIKKAEAGEGGPRLTKAIAH